jgi:sarcosine oxidase subunit delta
VWPARPSGILYKGAAVFLDRPADADPSAWDDYLHLRDNPAGVTTDLWYHETGCTSWLKVTRNTVTHEILGVDLVAPPARDAAAGDAAPAKASGKSPARKKKNAS